MRWQGAGGKSGDCSSGSDWLFIASLGDQLAQLCIGLIANEGRRGVGVVELLVILDLQILQGRKGVEKLVGALSVRAMSV